ncbi:hypothetical protein ACIQ8D_14330 [Streptomyces sp. NPDC096094]|uniref:hypothetical protein n=1 Tax=Streptomyces sp. NPDC096094 TaxID=3366073 RepID=UPI0037F36CE0
MRGDRVPRAADPVADGAESGRGLRIVAAYADRDGVERTLTAGLPQEPARHPAAFVARRLTADLPPALPASRPPVAGPRRPGPLQTCDGCERAFRAPRPGRSRDRRASSLTDHVAA